MIELRNLDIEDSSTIGEVIADSFFDDPVNQWVFGSKEGIQCYFSHVAKKLYLTSGYGHVISDLSGGSLWLPPHINKRIPLFNSLDIATGMLRHGGPKSLLRGIKIDHALGQPKPSTPHYYLYAIGCRPAERGKGYGGQLMEVGLEKANLDGLPVYLESSKESNISFYRRYGFEVMKKIVPTQGCPPLWLMWKEG